MCPPRHGSSPALFVCGGAQRGTSLATGHFTGESRQKPPAERSQGNRLRIRGLRKHDLGVLDSVAESALHERRKPLWELVAADFPNPGLNRLGVGGPFIRGLGDSGSCSHVHPRWRAPETAAKGGELPGAASHSQHRGKAATKPQRSNF
jgi:hypothetical protein